MQATTFAPANVQATRYYARVNGDSVELLNRDNSLAFAGKLECAIRGRGEAVATVSSDGTVTIEMDTFVSAML